ncbi:MAG: hypothetical protein HYX80_06700 [Chloroflexi bacterium]|nr:hypothetical protein [Chloroflexota bacterium]
MTTPEAPTRPKRRTGRIIGLTILGLVIIVLGIGTLLFFRVPQNMGLLPSKAERYLSGTPDREKAAVLTQDLQQAGFPTQGVSVYVLPFGDTNRNVVVVVLDASQGFDFGKSRGTDPVKSITKLMVDAQRMGIDRAAVIYRDEAGKELVSVTVPTDAAVAYSQGSLSDRQLMEKVELRVGDPPAALALLQRMK